jgi:hypothetical protein
MKKSYDVCRTVLMDLGLDDFSRITVPAAVVDVLPTQMLERTRATG